MPLSINQATRFLASASHDFGQPVNAARLYFEQLRRSTGTAEKAKAASGLEWALESVSQMVDQVTNYLRLDAGVVTGAQVAVPLGPVIAQVVEHNEPAARLGGVQLRTLATTLAVVGDKALIERALGNLIGNAIRHAGAARILVGAKRHQGRVRLWVIDDGRGVALADQVRLFDPYVQGTDHQGEVRGGYGLGLASVRLAAELMKGDAGYAPRWTNGSAFFVELTRG